MSTRYIYKLTIHTEPTEVRYFEVARYQDANAVKESILASFNPRPGYSLQPDCEVVRI